MSRFRVLVFTRADGFVHLSIPDAVRAIQALGVAHDFRVDTTAEPSAFSSRNLASYAALIFVHTSGTVLPGPDQRSALEGYIHGGGGFFGIHAASSLDPSIGRDWPWFRDLVGASFVGHTAAHIYCDEPIDLPGVVHAGPLSAAPPDAERISASARLVSWEPAVVNVEDVLSPAVRGIEDGAVRCDEWYGFDENPRPRVHVLASVDERTYEPSVGAMGSDHPIVWCREFDGGRTLYNAMGHRAATWRDDSFLASVLGGIEVTAGILPMTRPKGS